MNKYLIEWRMEINIKPDYNFKMKYLYLDGTKSEHLNIRIWWLFALVITSAMTSDIQYFQENSWQNSLRSLFIYLFNKFLHHPSHLNYF